MYRNSKWNEVTKQAQRVVAGSLLLTHSQYIFKKDFFFQLSHPSLFFFQFLSAASSDPTNYQSIHDAVKNCDVLHLELMVKNGASVNEVEPKDKFTPLHTACNGGALEVTSL